MPGRQPRRLVADTASRMRLADYPNKEFRREMQARGASADCGVGYVATREGLKPIVYGGNSGYNAGGQQIFRLNEGRSIGGGRYGHNASGGLGGFGGDPGTGIGPGGR